jgi:hypothetical protein
MNLLSTYSFSKLIRIKEESKDRKMSSGIPFLVSPATIINFLMFYIWWQVVSLSSNDRQAHDGASFLIPCLAVTL